MAGKEYVRLNSIFDTVYVIAEGAYVFLCEMKTNISRWSKSAVDFFDLPSEYMYDAGSIWAEHIHPDDRQAYEQSIADVFSGKSSSHNIQYRARSADGRYTVCTCRGMVIRNNDGTPEYFGGVIRNHGLFSYIDPVTGLRSLYGYFDDITGIFCQRRNALFVMLGLSSFSYINDVYGYNFGNRVLQVLSRTLSRFFGSDSTFYRMDGPHFGVISLSMTADEAAEKYEELRNYLQKEFFVDGEKITLTLNGGAVQADRMDVASETLYSCLRYTYNESKHNKCGDFTVFSDIVTADNKKVIERLNTIRGCISQGCRGFYLCYQPIVDAKTEKLKGMEALIRWKDESYGVVPPGLFIPVLEQDAMFPELGRWILRQAMTDGKQFLKINPDLVINVNLSYTQIKKNSFLKELFELIEETGFPIEHLCLEITERCRLLDTEMLKDMFSILRQRGVKIAVDDFGTGFSSLGFLRNIPVDVVKIDREFVKDIRKNTADQYSVKFISELAGAFSADVCAEGIENIEVRDFLKNYNIGSLQGYYYSKPVTVNELLEKINAG
ncbi:MAG: GGDEF and EAL domain-containing protein [Ruminococcus sp.]|nr:GGDEF and EAL domain-containing protein [Ruminococcus sp.]